jgi:hypothetical protein
VEAKISAGKRERQTRRPAAGIVGAKGWSGKSGENKLSFNVIHFVPGNDGSGEEEEFIKMTKLTRGEYSQVKGMAAIQSYVSAQERGDLANAK